jgi:hypothetical protein
MKLKKRHFQIYKEWELVAKQTCLTRNAKGNASG